MSDSETPWVDGLTVPQTLHQAVERFGDQEAVVFPQLGLRWTFVEYEQKAREVARALVALGIQSGEHIGIWATNWPEWILVQFGAAMAGAVLVNLNPTYRTHEAAYVIEHADLVALFITDSFKSSDHEAMMGEMIPELAEGSNGEALESEQFPLLRHVICIKNKTKIPGIRPWAEFLELASDGDDEEIDARVAQIDPNHPVSIQYTSGTTGKPKGAMLSHRNLLMNAFYIGTAMGAEVGDRLCSPMPLFHCFGCVAGSLTSVVCGMTYVNPSEWFDPEVVLAAIESEKCVALYGVPTMFMAEIHHPNFEKYNLKTLKKGMMAGSICPPDLCQRVNEQMFLTDLLIGYGLTECSPAVTLTIRHDPTELRLMTIGKPIPGVEVRVLKPGTWDDVEPGEQGEIATRGHNVMLGYYKRPEETAETIDPDGWLRTGDLGEIMESGHYQITGRSKDMIIRGGENVYPREIEDFLLTHPSVRDAQVTGLPDEFFGEQICAWIVLAEPGALTEDEVRAFCKAKIAHYKVPHYVVFVESFPMTSSGKVQKFKLREMGVEKFGLH